MPSWGYQLTFHNREYLEKVFDLHGISFIRLHDPFVCNCKEDWTDGTGWCENCGCERINE